MLDLRTPDIYIYIYIDMCVCRLLNALETASSSRGGHARKLYRNCTVVACKLHTELALGTTHAKLTDTHKMHRHCKLVACKTHTQMKATRTTRVAQGKARKQNAYKCVETAYRVACEISNGTEKNIDPKCIGHTHAKLRSKCIETAYKLHAKCRQKSMQRVQPPAPHPQPLVQEV